MPNACWDIFSPSAAAYSRRPKTSSNLVIMTVTGRYILSCAVSRKSSSAIKLALRWAISTRSAKRASAGMHSMISLRGRARWRLLARKSLMMWANSAPEPLAQASKKI